MRYLPLTDADRRLMLERIGADSVDAFYENVPEEARLKGLLDLPAHQGEMAVEAAIGAMASRNLSPAEAPCFLGAGAYRHHVPASVDHLIQRSEFLTSYTPYQPEISQGTLQYLFEFQTQVAAITGMEVANASMYDGATATAEAVLMAHRIGRRRSRSVVSGGLHPHYREVVRTTVQYSGVDVDFCPLDESGDEDLIAAIGEDTACVVVQNPDVFGRVRDLTALADACHAAGALLVVAVGEVVSLGLMTPPGEMGADIVVAEGQSLGVPLSFGGPYVGLMATRKKYIRQLPGRLCGVTTDMEGRRSFVLTLSAREQHIRREKATSNICTNSGLCALAFCIHLTLLGEEGFARLARINHARAMTLAGKLAAIDGVEVLNDTYFNEFTLRLSRPAEAVVEELAERGILGGVPLVRLDPAADAGLLLVAATETVSDEDMDRLSAALKEVLA